MNCLINKLQKTCFIALMLLVISCSQPIEKIVIISTNDMHAAIDKFANLATLVEQYRAQDSTRVLLIDAGDRWTGNPYVDLASQQCYPIIELMNTLRYDIGTIGNHEFDHGMELLAQRMNDAQFEKVISNMALNGAQFSPIKPYTFRTVAGFKIGFIGVVTTAVDGHPEGKPENFGAATFEDALKVSERYTWLKDSCDMLVALTHIGYEVDTILARRQPQYSLVIGGHSHTVLPNGTKIGNTLVTQTGKSLKYAGVTTITVQGKKILDVQNTLVRLDTIAACPRYAKMVERYMDNPILQGSVGKSAVAMNKTGLLNMMSDIMRESTSVDIALMNVGSVRMDSLSKGDISLANVFAIEPFGNSPYIVEMTLEEVKTMILNKFNGTDKEAHMVDIYPSGLSYQIVTDGRGVGTDVFFKPYTTPNKKLFKVAMSDYMHSTYKFNKQGKGMPTGLMITDLTIEHLKQHNPINFGSDSRVEIK